MTALNGTPLAQLEQFAQLWSQLTARDDKPINKFSAWNIYEVDLADQDVAASSLNLGRATGKSGYGIYFLRRGSNPGALLSLNCGGVLRTFGPGDSFTGTFDDFTVKSAAGGAVIGKALLLIITNPRVNYEEVAAAIIQGDATTLLGTIVGTAVTTVSVAEDTDPSGVMPQGAFDVTGWKQIRVLIDTNSNGGNATSFDLVPWLDPLNSGTWYEQGTERISVPDTDVTGGRWRVVNVPLSGGPGRLYFSIRNLLAAGRTALGFAVQGVS